MEDVMAGLERKALLQLQAFVDRQERELSAARFSSLKKTLGRVNVSRTFASNSLLVCNIVKANELP